MCVYYDLVFPRGLYKSGGLVGCRNMGEAPETHNTGGNATQVQTKIF